MSDKVWRPDDVANLPEPAGAVHIDDWEIVAEGSPPSRFFTGRRWVLQERMGNGRVVDRVVVRIDGWQWADGRVDRDVVVASRAPEWPLGVAQTRELAGLLLAAADEIERLAEHR